MRLRTIALIVIIVSFILGVMVGLAAIFESDAKAMTPTINLTAAPPVPEPEFIVPGWDEETAVTLARSCVGEAGWNTWQTGECSMMAWVYHARVKAYGSSRSYRDTVLRYSAALKRGCGDGTKAYILPEGKQYVKDRRWLHELPADGFTKPKSWPKNASWTKLSVQWRNTLAYVDTWARGEVPRLIPANHYGGYLDFRLAELKRGWKRLCVPRGTKNRFYNSRRRVDPSKLGPMGQRTCYL